MHILATFSIVACDLKAQAWGVAVASKFPAVGAIVPWARAKAGAVATQALANTSFGPRGLELMGSNHSAYESLRELLAHDRDREHRQVGIVDARGGSATFTGKSCSDWAGGVSGAGYAIQGNILSSPDVVRQMEQTFLEERGDLPARLLAALEAGGHAGGDRRGRQSAALIVVKPKGGYGGHNDRWIDSERVRLQGQNVRDIQNIMKGLGYYTPADGEYGDATREAFRAFIANENFEERADPDAGWIDAPVLDYLIKKLK
jgi:uncharacterized Ntn-hydrolase superfamily protein